MDEFCEGTGEVPAWPAPPPVGPIFAYTDPSTPEEWSFDIAALQAKIIHQNDDPLVACVWPDVFQKPPEKKHFVLVAKRLVYRRE